MQWMHLLLILHRRVWLHRCFTRFWLYSTATPHCRALHQLQVRHLKIWNLFSHDYCNVTQGREDGCKQNDLPWWPTDHLKWKWDHKCQQQWRRHSRIVLRDVRKKKTGKCGNFSQVMDPPPPVWECHVFWEKNYGLFCIFWTLETFIVGGGVSHVKNSKKWKWDLGRTPPHPQFFQNSKKKKKLGKASFAKIPLFYLSKHTSNTLKTPINNTLQTTFKIIYFFRSKSGRKNK